MTSAGAPPGGSKLARLVVPALEKVIRNASWRKHARLVQDCKAAVEWFARSPPLLRDVDDPEPPAASGAPTTAAVGPAAAAADGAPAAPSSAAVASPEPSSDATGPSGDTLAQQQPSSNGTHSTDAPVEQGSDSGAEAAPGQADAGAGVTRSEAEEEAQAVPEDANGPGLAQVPADTQAELRAEPSTAVVTVADDSTTEGAAKDATTSASSADGPLEAGHPAAVAAAAETGAPVDEQAMPTLAPEETRPAGSQAPPETSAPPTVKHAAGTAELTDAELRPKATAPVQVTSEEPAGKATPLARGRVVLYEEGGTGYGAEDAESVLRPLTVACETLLPRMAEPALDCLQRLISHGHLQGEMDAEASAAASASTGGVAGDGTGSIGLLPAVMDAICRCYDTGDEGVELLVLKALLTAITSAHLRVHGECLLKAVRTCYNIFLGSKAPVNQTTAKASLTQMLVVVFRRMEADSSTVPVAPIVVADLMDPVERSGSGGQDQNMAHFVQGFITRAVEDMEVALAPALPSPVVQQLRQSRHDGAFEATAGGGKEGGTADAQADLLEATDKDMLDVKYWEVNMDKSSLDGVKGAQATASAAVAAEAAAAMAAVPTAGGDGAASQNGVPAALISGGASGMLMMGMNPPAEGASDPFAIRGKIVALELLKILLENAGLVFRTNERFVGAIKQYLCLSLLKNSTSSLMPVFQLSCTIFMSLVSRFRASLKAEIGVFFPMIVLRVLENVAHANYQQKTVVLRFLEKLCIDPQILVDIFVNYDCDVDSPNIFERMVNGLLKTAQGVPPGADTALTPQQDANLRLAAMKCLVGVMRSMGNWTNRQLRLTKQARPLEVEEQPESGEEGTEAATPMSSATNVEASEDAHASEPPEMHGPDAATFEQRRNYKLEFQEGVALFNKKPRKGIDFLIKVNKVGSTPEDIAKFLREASGLDKTMIGDYLGEKEDLALKVMHAYIDSFDFQDQDFDEAIRSFLNGFRLPGEAQKIDRIVEKFAERYCRCNPSAFSSADTAYVLGYSVIMLNTDAHNPMVKNKMSKAEFIKNNRGIDNNKDLPEEFLSGLYDRIVRNEIKMKADTMVASKAAQATTSNRLLALDSILNLVARKAREAEPLESSDDVIRHMQESFRAKAGKTGSIYYAASDVETIRPMVEVVWAPMLAGFSVPLDKSEEEVVTFQCLEGFRHAVHVTMAVHQEVVLYGAVQAIIAIADEDGDYLQDAWEHILTCVSRFEHLHLIGEGAPPDAAFFAAPQLEVEKKQALKVPALRRKIPGKLQYAAAAARRGSYDSAGVGGQGAGVVTPEQMSNLVVNLNMLEQIGSFEVSRIFARSERLNSEAIVDFVQALCKVSLEELRSPTDPRVFSLTKIVEISHFNMKRIRLVWNRIWSVLADYFVTVGCMENLSVAMYAMDSLRQLAMKFLERDELANFNFQNEFLKPFVVVMRRSKSVEIRELNIRCVSQMVFARVANVKSGWKSMFMVFTTAATDDHKNIVLLAFETIEKIVREYFPYITETETTTFTDCVNCLIAFTNSRFNKDVSLNAIAFLRFCALKLAEGELGSRTKGKGLTKGSPDGETFTDRDDHVYFWFPLLAGNVIHLSTYEEGRKQGRFSEAAVMPSVLIVLMCLTLHGVDPRAGLSELTFDPRPDIRRSALEVLFDTLRFHGHMFSPALWERVFDSVLFPIFDYVRRASEPSMPSPRAGGSMNGEEKDKEELEMDAWLYETCTLALQLVVDLFVKFYSVVAPLLERILSLLTGFIKRSHQSLAAIGVAAFVRLMSNAGELFSEDKWQEVLLALQDSAEATLPDMTKLAQSIAADEDGEGGQGRLAEPRHSMEEDEDEAGVDVLGVADQLGHVVADVRCKTAVQLLLVQAMTEVYELHGTRLSVEHTLLLLDTLQSVAAHAHAVNGNLPLRRALSTLQAATQMPDPPLLRLESEAFHAYLTLLQRLPLEKPDLAAQVDVELRLVKLCSEVLAVYVQTATTGSSAAHERQHEFQMEAREPSATSPESQQDGMLQRRRAVVRWFVPLSSARRRELVDRAPLVVATLRALEGLGEPALRSHLKRFFPVLAELVSCEHGSPTVQSVLSSMFASRIGPILLEAKS
eukprot:SM000061S19222  [mRNA]  locus=s61:207593:216818:+ [translate_table: standard]